MGNYRVITGQNIYDVALHLYGSIEGIVDLLINNPGLSLETELRTGQELTYTCLLYTSPSPRDRG
mgnify:CR=1 FL=1